jgi:hypothetical protein
LVLLLLVVLVVQVAFDQARSEANAACKQTTGGEGERGGGQKEACSDQENDKKICLPPCIMIMKAETDVPPSMIKLIRVTVAYKEA